MNNLGLLYQRGQAVPPDIDSTGRRESAQDLDQARYWFERSAALGNTSAMNDLGTLYGFARGFTRDYGRALQWFRKAASLGSGDAMGDLGTMYYYGRGVAQDYKQARYWWEKAVARDDVSAMGNLGYLYQCGNGVPQDMKKAMRLYEKAAARGSAAGMNNLALMYSGIIGIPVDRDKQKQWLEKAAALEDPTAMYSLARMYDDPQGVPQDYALARSWYERSAALAMKGNDNDPGSVMSVYRLADMYERGIGVAKDYSRAREWYEKAAALGEADAMLGLARVYREGLGVAKDERLAGEWQLKAAALRPPPEHKPEEPPLCDPDLIDATFTFADQPAGEQTVSLHFKNKSGASCRLHGQPGPSFAVDGHSMRVESCWLCDHGDKPSPMPERQPGNQILLPPGKQAKVDLHWASAGESCQRADWVDFFVQWSKQAGYLFIPNGWPMHVCSAVKSSGYRAEADSPYVATMKDGLLRVSVLQKAVYSDERAELHVELTERGRSVVRPTGCAELYTVRHGPSDGTRLDPLLAKDAMQLVALKPDEINADEEKKRPSWQRGYRRKCETAGEITSADAQIDAANLANVTHVEWRAARRAGNDPVFLVAATQFTVLDVDTLPPNWGEPVKGIRAGLSVDRVDFRVGERIPLHLRWENVDAALQLAQGECKEPVPTLEIQDAEHKVLRTLPVERGCMGHGWGPFAIEKGKAQRTFSELTTDAPSSPYAPAAPANLLGPGVYYLVSVWSPRVLDAASKDEADKLPRFGGARMGGVYATARSQSVRIEVAPSGNP